MKEIAKTRFSMVKKRHSQSLKKAKQKKEIDKEMVSLCNYINGTKNYFTSSGCSGRILLLSLANGSKRNASFHRKWHNTIKPEKVISALEEKTKGEIWLKMEPFIIHIGTNSLENARKLLSLKNKSGIKRGGIIVAKPGKFVVELIGTEKMSLPIKRNEKILASREFIKETVIEANKKMKKNQERVKKFEKTVRKEL